MIPSDREEIRRMMAANLATPHPKESSMATFDPAANPNDARWMRLEALKLARQGLGSDARAETVVEHARAYADFLMGTDRAALADEAKAAVDRAVK